MAFDLRSNRRLRVAVTLGLLATSGVLLYLGQHQPSLRMVAMVVLALSVATSRIGKVTPTQNDSVGLSSAANERGESVRWWIGGALLLAVGLSRWFLGYATAHNLWFPYPIYLFAATVVAAAWWAFGQVTKRM